jgi:hypothetical protein
MEVMTLDEWVQPKGVHGPELIQGPPGSSYELDFNVALGSFVCTPPLKAALRDLADAAS